MSLFSGAKSQSRSEQHDALAVMLFCGGALPPFLLSYGKKPYSHTMLGYYHTILATVIRFSGTGIRCWVTTIRYSATGIRFSFHRIPVAHGEQEVEGPKGPAEWLTRIHPSSCSDHSASCVWLSLLCDSRYKSINCRDSVSCVRRWQKRNPK